MREKTNTKNLSVEPVWLNEHLLICCKVVFQQFASLAELGELFFRRFSACVEEAHEQPFALGLVKENENLLLRASVRAAFCPSLLSSVWVPAHRKCLRGLDRSHP